MRRLLLLGAIVALGALGIGGALAGTGDSSDVLIADLSGDHEVPALASDGSGFASFTVSADEMSIDYRLYANDIIGVTQSHIHIGEADANGPVAVFLFGFADPAVDPDGLLAEGTLTAADLTGAVAGMAELVSAVRSGGAYVNMHTVANPAGEIRGQTRPAPMHLSTSLSGDNEVPPLVSTGTGFASFEVSADEMSIDYRLYANDIMGVTQSHIHIGEAGENGSVAVFLFGFADPAVDPDGLLAEGTLTGADLTAVVVSMGELIDRLRSGHAYVNMHTIANPPGEIRGQIGPSAFNFAADLSGDNHAPPVMTDGTGFAAMTVDGTQTSLDYTVLVHGVVDVTQAHIHLAPAGENGSVVAPLFGFEAAGVTPDGILMRGTVTVADLIARPGFDASMGQLLDHLRAGTAYVNVHTIANPPGEVRGQLGPLARPVGQGGTFTDDDRSVHQANIEVIAAAGVTLGCNPPANDNFCGTDPLTRGQGAAFLFRALNLQPSATDFFTDDDGSLFETEINGIAAFGITKGCNPPANDNFCPNDTMTRAQWASLLVRALGLTDGGGIDTFTDDDGSVHEANINRLAAAGITKGCNPPTNDNFCPTDVLERGQAASFLTRAMGWVGATP